MQNHHLIRFVFKEIHFGQLHREWIYVVSQDPINKTQITLCIPDKKNLDKEGAELPEGLVSQSRD